jgi:hypothetical protein
MILGVLSATLTSPDYGRVARHLSGTITLTRRLASRLKQGVCVRLENSVLW